MPSAFSQGVLSTPLAVALGGTGFSSIGTAGQVIAVNGTATGLEFLTVGILSDGDKGDITVSSSGSVWTIDNLSVTNAKINDVAWSKITSTPTTIAGYGISDAQPLNAILTDLSGLTQSSDTLPYFDSSTTATTTPLSSFGRSIIDDVDASSARTTLGLGSLATQNGTFSGTSSGTNTGDQTITLTGDVTGTGTGSFSATISSGSVTYSKIQNTSSGNVVLARAASTPGEYSEVLLGASQILGRGSTGDISAITLGTGLSMSGTTLNASGSGDVVGPASATNNAVVLFDGTSGKLVKNSTVTISSGVIVATSVQPTAGVLAGSSSQTITTSSSAQLFGSTSTLYQLGTGGITATLTADFSAVGTLLRQSTFTEAATGTHPLIANLAVRAPVITNGSGATTNAVTLYVEGAPTGTASPTNVYALWVDDGVVRIDGTIELGAASDTTLSRSAAGVLAVEGVAVPTISSTSTLTNKRIDPRVVSAASYTTSTTIDSDATDVYVVTAQAGALLFNNPSGTPVQGQKLIIRIKDDGTARVLTYGSEFRGISQALPSTTVISKTLYMGFIRNSTDTKWDLIAVAQES